LNKPLNIAKSDREEEGVKGLRGALENPAAVLVCCPDFASEPETDSESLIRDCSPTGGGLGRRQRTGGTALLFPPTKGKTRLLPSVANAPRATRGYCRCQQVRQHGVLTSVYCVRRVHHEGVDLRFASTGVDDGVDERVLFIGTRFSNLYTAVETPAEAA
jgi:hypothetical protein